MVGIVDSRVGSGPDWHGMFLYSSIVQLMNFVALLWTHAGGTCQVSK